MKRDKYRALEFWDKGVSRILKNDGEFDVFAHYKAELEAGTSAGPLSGLFTLHTLGWIDQVAYRYSRGDDLQEIKTEVIDEAVERYIKVTHEIEMYRSKFDIPHTHFYPFLTPVDRAQDAYTLVSWLVCFGVDADKLATLAPFIAPPDVDRILDTVLVRYQPSRLIARSVACPRTHRLIDEMLDADSTKQIALAEKYLDRWAKLMSTLNGMGMLNGASRANGAKSNADLAKLAEHGLFKGFWAWELAMIVRILDIDDSSFADHQLYPADLVHFNR